MKRGTDMGQDRPVLWVQRGGGQRGWSFHYDRANEAVISCTSMTPGIVQNLNKATKTGDGNGKDLSNMT